MRTGARRGMVWRGLTARPSPSSTPSRIPASSWRNERSERPPGTPARRLRGQERLRGVVVRAHVEEDVAAARVVAALDHDELLVAQVHVDEARRLGRALRETKIDPPAREALDHSPVHVALHLDLHTGMLAQEGRERGQDHAGHQGRQSGDADRAAIGGGRRLEGAQQLLLHGPLRFHEFQHATAGLGERHARCGRARAAWPPGSPPAPRCGARARAGSGEEPPPRA